MSIEPSQRYFVGLSLDETAEVLDLSVPTVTRRWSYSKSWFRREMGGAA